MASGERERPLREVPPEASPTPRQPAAALEEGGASRLAVSPLLRAIPRHLVETFHYLVARLQLDDHAMLPRRIAIVSALRGEGVSTMARTLAAVLANDLDAKVCLVNLSTSGPAKRNDRAEARPVGLLEVLTDDLPLDQALRRTADPRLMLLGAGNVDAAGARHLTRAPQLPAVLAALDDQFDHIVFDVPPILGGSDALAMVRHADAYLMVVQHGVTPIDQVRAATEEMRAVPSLGVIINQYSTRIPKGLRRFFAP